MTGAQWFVVVVLGVPFVIWLVASENGREILGLLLVSAVLCMFIGMLGTGEWPWMWSR